MMAKTINTFLQKIYERNPRQKSSIEYTMNNCFCNDDYEQLCSIIHFYQKDMTTDEIAEAYNLIVEDTAKETKYFITNGHYRYSSFEETEKLVYSNQEYMSKYMVGLAISGYLWSNHIRMFHWYKQVLQNVSGIKYLEVGPGHGKYFCEAVRSGRFDKYDAIDVSETSVQQTKQYLTEYLDQSDIDRCCVFKQNAYDYKPGDKYDFVVIAEVLEHIEDPRKMLEILHDISNAGAKLYITVPINAPAIDHIYLFKSTDEVETMVETVGYDIIDRLYAPAGDMDIERAIKRKNSILVGLLARKN